MFGKSSNHPRHARGFTLIELLVVVAILALLMSFLLPSLARARKQAQAVACMAELDQVLKALRMYQDDYVGWLPTSWDAQFETTGSIWSEAAWWVSKPSLWFYKLVPKYLGDPKALRCPGDPVYAAFDFEADGPNGSHTNTKVPSCGYGMNYMLRHWQTANAPQYMCNTDRYGPTRPASSILLAEVGPDEDVKLCDNNTYTPSVAWRDGGRLVWDDGVQGRPWYNGSTWLTARHLGGINVGAFDDSVKHVTTVKQLTLPQAPYYGSTSPFGDCAGRFRPPGSRVWTCVCALCLAHERHYTFADSKMWWWAGEIRPP